MFKLLNMEDEMVKSDKPKNVFEKYKQLFQKMSNLKKRNQSERTFFLLRSIYDRIYTRTNPRKLE